MGLLISNNGLITLPCALFLLGAALLAIGQYRCNLDSETIFGSENGDVTIATSTSPTSTTAGILLFLASFFHKPLQWKLGSSFIVLATTILFFESDVFIYFKTYFKLSSMSSSSSLSVRKNEDDVETEIMSKYYSNEEIMNRIRDIANREIQRNLESKVEEKKQNGSKLKELKRDFKKAICCINALAFKIDTINNKKKSYTKANEQKAIKEKNDEGDEVVFQTSQEASFIILRTFPNIDEIVSSSLSLLALTAKSDTIRKRHLLQEDRGDMYNITLPIGIMKSSLERTKKKESYGSSDDDDDDGGGGAADEEEEQLAAEVQRKACIYLGALSDGNFQLASQIVQNNGLESILACINWFRFHLHVVNWALWAIFNLCFDHPGNKCEFVRLDGIGKVCGAMKNVLKEEKIEATLDDQGSNDTHCRDNDDLEVARHGIAIFFDLLRYDPASDSNGESANQPKLDFVRVRRIALNAGLHEILLISMTKFPKDVQVMMMGQQMLIATGYKGEIPSFQGQIVRK